jgi:hypothetical protein
MRGTIVLLALLASGCSTASSQSFADFAKQIASDPRCGHTDRVQGNLGGGVTGNSLAVYLERVCPPAASQTAATGGAPTPAGP